MTHLLFDILKTLTIYESLYVLSGFKVKNTPEIDHTFSHKILFY